MNTGYTLVVFFCFLYLFPSTTQPQWRETTQGKHKLQHNSWFGARHFNSKEPRELSAGLRRILQPGELSAGIRRILQAGELSAGIRRILQAGELSVGIRRILQPGELPVGIKSLLLNTQWPPLTPPAKPQVLLKHKYFLAGLNRKQMCLTYLSPWWLRLLAG